MEEKKNKGLVWLLVVLIILFIGLVSLVVYKTLKKDKIDDSNDSQEISLNEENKVIESRGLDYYLSNEYKLVDLDKIDIKSKLAEREHYTIGMDTIENERKKYSDSGVLYYLELGLNVGIENKKMFFEFNSNKKIIDDFDAKEVIMFNFGCGVGPFTVVLLDYNGDVYVWDDMIDILDNGENYLVENIKASYFKKINSNQKYDDIYIISMPDVFDTCGVSYNIIGKTLNGEEYNVKTNKQYKEYSLSDIYSGCEIYVDRTAECYYSDGNEIEFDKKLEGILLYFNDKILTKERFLYNLHNEDASKMTKISQSKVDKLLNKQTDNKQQVVVILENNDEYLYEFNGEIKGFTK